MPRNGRGGMRQGSVGQSYGNRTDLNSSMPVQTATGQPYGVAAEQRAAQQAIPVAAQPITPAPRQAVQSAPTAPPAPLSDQITPPSMPSAYPGELRFLDPTDHPDEPITSGIDLGPGVGSDAIYGPTAPVAGDLSALVAQSGGSPLLLDLANAASVLGL